MSVSNSGIQRVKLRMQEKETRVQLQARVQRDNSKALTIAPPSIERRQGPRGIRSLYPSKRFLLFSSSVLPFLFFFQTTVIYVPVLRGTWSVFLGVVGIPPARTNPINHWSPSNKNIFKNSTYYATGPTSHHPSPSLLLTQTYSGYKSATLVLTNSLTHNSVKENPRRREEKN